MNPNPEKTTVSVTLPAGTHWICTCGQSKNYPHCDGAHTGSAFTPNKVELDAPKSLELTR